VKDYASDLLPLRLASVTTIVKLMGLVGTEDIGAIAAMCVTLLAMRMYLFAVNTRVLDPSIRAKCIWISLIILTSIRGFAEDTRRNLACSACPLVFVCMMNDVCNLRMLTEEPAEHAFGNLRQTTREFTVMDMIYLIEKKFQYIKAVYEVRLSVKFCLSFIYDSKSILTNANHILDLFQIQQSNLVTSRDPGSGYQASIASFIGSTNAKDGEELIFGKVKLDHASPKTYAKQVWDHGSLKMIMETANLKTKHFLGMFGVTDETLSPFCKESCDDLKASVLDPLKEILPSNFHWNDAGQGEIIVDGVNTEVREPRESDDGDSLDALSMQREAWRRRSINNFLDTIQQANEDENVEVEDRGEMGEVIEETGAETILVDACPVDIEEPGGSSESRRDEEMDTMVEDLDQGMEVNNALMNLLHLGSAGNETEQSKLEKIPLLVFEVMKLMELKGREKGSERVDTKAMSLKARYFAKNDNNSGVEGHRNRLNDQTIAGNSHIIVKRQKSQETLHYKVLSVSKKYYNKWYMYKPNETLPQFDMNKKPDIRLSVQLLIPEMVDGKVGYSPVRTFEKYKVDEVYTTIAGSSILKVDGVLGFN